MDCPVVSKARENPIKENGVTTSVEGKLLVKSVLNLLECACCETKKIGRQSIAQRSRMKVTLEYNVCRGAFAIQILYIVRYCHEEVLEMN